MTNDTMIIKCITGDQREQRIMRRIARELRAGEVIRSTNHEMREQIEFCFASMTAAERDEYAK